jgi:ABC-2 type transport system permease protein
MLEDRIDGSIIKIFMSPVSTVSYIFQNLLSAIMPVVVQIVILGILGIVRYNWEVEILVGISVTLLIFAVTNTAFSFCWNMFFKSKSGSRYSFMFVGAVMLLLSGIMVPIEALPGIMQYIGAIFHTYWLMRGLNVLALEGMSASFWIYQGVMLLFATAFLLLGGRRRTI